jgi:hypothetical protein
MACSQRSGIALLRPKILPTCIGALLAVHATAAFARGDTGASRSDAAIAPAPDKVRRVTNCDDSGAGSLRDAVASAVNGDAIDLTELGCSSITLSGGKIAATMGDLTLIGPGVGPDASHPLTIHGSDYDRIFDHGAGTLAISGLELTGGRAFAKGGCIVSQGSLVIESSIITGCEAYVPYGEHVIAAGGAIYTQAELWIHKSTITNNTAFSAANEVAYGGAVFASGIVTIEESTIADNKATAPLAYSAGGGLMVVGIDDVNILNSTISGNDADTSGGVRINTLGNTVIVNSTLSDNHAAPYSGAGYFSNSPVRLLNSTVVRNASYGYPAGIYSNQAITVESSILADNRSTATASIDICTPSIMGGSDLITSSCVAPPAQTLSECPRLTALGNHGGPTPTHALLPGSPGIDAGDHTLALTADQRGELYPRVFGIAADIGAFELQGDFIDDALFKSAFEIACDEY